jgi:uncharacterized protein (DUF1697 family)
VLLRGVNNLGGKKVAMAELRGILTSLGHADVMTYIQSGNVLFTPRRTGSAAEVPAYTAALAGELERAIADGIGVLARAVVLPREELARCLRDNPYPGEANPKLLHGVFLPEMPGPALAAWLADAERQVRAKGSRDAAQVRARTVYLHTPDGYPGSELRRVLARAGGPTSAPVGGTARNWATVTRLAELCGADSAGAALCVEHREEGVEAFCQERAGEDRVRHGGVSELASVCVVAAGPRLPSLAAPACARAIQRYYVLVVNITE